MRQAEFQKPHQGALLCAYKWELAFQGHQEASVGFLGGGTGIPMARGSINNEEAIVSTEKRLRLHAGTPAAVAKPLRSRICTLQVWPCFPRYSQPGLSPSCDICSQALARGPSTSNLTYSCGFREDEQRVFYASFHPSCRRACKRMRHRTQTG